MPNRITYESRCTSASLANVSSDAEVLMDRLTTKADDFGRYDARLAVIRGACFSLKLAHWTEARISNALEELEREDVIRRYTAEGRECLYFPKWEDYQRRRATASKYPDPPALADIRVQPQASADIGGSRNVLVHVPVPAVDSKNKDSDFDAFWAVYPRQQGKGEARRSFVRALAKPGLTPDVLIAAAESYANDPNRDDGFTAMPATWLNQERWGDGPVPPRTSHTNGAARTLELARRLEEAGQ